MEDTNPMKQWFGKQWPTIDPCPFCGSANTRVIYVTTMDDPITAGHCMDCGCLGPMTRPQTPDVAAQRWGERK